MRWPDTPEDPNGLKAMCRYGIEQVKLGRAVELKLSCMPNEAERLHAIMREFPDVPYSLSYPDFESRQ